MEIVKFPNPNLFVPCKEVNVFGPELLVLLEAMWETMKASNGVGLAANQVGLTYRMFVMEGPKQEKLFLVNPVITKVSKTFSSFKEGCLSAPGEYVFLGSRYSWVEVEYLDEKGNKKRGVFSGLHSVCTQHEIDHLDGKSFMESEGLSRAKRKELAKKWGLNTIRK